MNTHRFSLTLCLLVCTFLLVSGLPARDGRAATTAEHTFIVK